MFNQNKEVQEFKPIFFINPRPQISELPEIKEKTKIDIKYTLIEPYVNAHIFWDTENNELVYHVEEPELDENEINTLNILENGINELINISFIAIKNTDVVIEFLEKNIRVVLSELKIAISRESYLKLMYYIYRDFVGLNEIEPLLKDYYIEDIECNGINTPIYIVHRKYRNLRTNVIFRDVNKITSFVEKLAQKCGKYISYATPLLDASLPDGSRVNATFTQDISSKGPSFTVRKFTKEPWTPIKLMQFKTVSPEILAYLWLLIENESNIMIIGGTGSGKTSFLNALAFFIPPAARVVSIEDTRELNILHENWLPGVTREGVGASNLIGTKEGDITLFDLLRESFRQRPDYVIVGEVRGKEAYVLFQGMSSLRGDEEIFILDNNKPLRIKIKDLENLDIKNLKAICYDTENKQVEILPIQAFVKHPKRNILYKINTKLGREITVTPDHSLFTLIDNKIIDIKTDQLLIGSKLIIPSSIPCGYNNIEEINLFEYLPDIRVYAPEYIKEASHKLGYLQASSLCGCASITDYYSNFKRSKPSAMKSEKFLKLMQEAEIKFDINKLEFRYDRKSKGFEGNLKLTDDFLNLLGYYLSEGSLDDSEGNSSIALYNKKESVLDDMRKCIYNLTGLIPHERITKGYGSCLELSFNHKVLFEFLKRYCKKKQEKRIPDFIFGFDKRRIGVFLSALYCGDGMIKQSHFDYYTTSKNLANDVSQLLLVYGIVAKIGKRNRIGRKTTDYEIKFYMSYKKKEFSKYVKPIGKEIDLKLFKKTDFKLLGDLYCDEIKSIEILNLEKPEYVYDISIPKNQNFIGGFGGILAHNSGHPSFGTMHAEDVETMVRRLETPPIELSASLVESLDVVCVITQAKAQNKDVRRIKEVVEIIKVREGVGNIETNTPFVWDPRSDNFFFKEESVVFDKISLHKGISKAKLQREFVLRTKLLMALYNRNIFGFKEVYDIINAYYKTPENVLKKFNIS